MLRTGLVLAVGIVLATNALAAGTPAGPWPPERQGWIFGFGLGGGSAALTANGNATHREGGGTGHIRFGYSFTPDVAVEIDSNGWTKSEQGGTLSFTNFVVALSYYPGDGPLMLRGGAGFGSADFTAYVSGEQVSVSEGGFGAHAAAGYEFRVRRTFAVGPLVSYSYISTSSSSADWVDGQIAFNWYFVPQH